jgi:hypothetical protein
MANDIISKTGLFAVAVGGIVGIGVGSLLAKTPVNERTEWDEAFKELEEEKRQEIDKRMQQLEGEKGAEIKDLREQYTSISQQLEGKNRELIENCSVLSMKYKEQTRYLENKHRDQIFQLDSRLSSEIEMLKGSNRKSKEANQTRIRDLQIKHIAEVEQLKEEHRIEIAEHSLHENSDGEMRQRHKQQVQALNTRLEQLESQIQEIGQAYETEKLAEVDSAISSIEQRYRNMLESQQNTAEVKEQDMHIQHKNELGIMQNEYIESLREHNAEHDNEMLRASKASKSQLLKLEGKYRQNIVHKEQGKNEQIELLKQKHEAQINDLRNEYEEAKQSLIDKQDLESNKKRSRASL